MRIWRDRSGITPGDALLVLATLSLAFALAYPTLERKAMRDRAGAAGEAVEAVTQAALRYRNEHAAWPASADEGTTPPELTGYLAADVAFQAEGYTLKWDRWERVHEPPQPDAPAIAERSLLQGEPPPPPAPDSVSLETPTVLAVGTVTVVGGDPRVLAWLLERFGPGRSFVRDGAWTLVVSEPTPPSEPSDDS